MSTFLDSYNLKDKIVEKKNGYNEFKESNIKEKVFEDADVIRFQNEFSNDSLEFKKYLIEVLINSKATKNTKDEVRSKLFSEYSGVDLVDKYDVYQVLANNWTSIEVDLGRINAEGKGICKELEEEIVSKKNSKTKKIEDVVVGMKGKVIPLDLIKTEFFQSDFEKLEIIRSEIENAVSEYLDIFENINEEVKSLIVKENDETKHDVKRIKQAIKHENLEDDDKKQLQTMLDAIELEKTQKKQIKIVETELNNKAMEKIGALTDEEVNELLVKKWIEPIIDGINNVADSALTKFVGDLDELKKKYDNPLSDISKQEKEVTSQLKDIMSDLCGSDLDMAAIHMLMEEL